VRRFPCRTLIVMRWRRSFSSPTTSNTQWRRVWSVIPLILVLAWAAAAFGVTLSCGPEPSNEVLTHRQADKLLLVQAKPVYPPLARINYIRGHVRLLVTVNSQGKVENVHVVRGHPFLAIAALRAIRRWVYRPFETNSGPAKFQTLVDVNFALAARDITEERFPSQPDKFLERAVHPPKIISQSGIKSADESVRLRVLLNKRGRVMDATLVSGPQQRLQAACRAIAHWKFQPARWGNLNVPWYLNVDVPVKSDLSQPKSPK
jgi:TonB family protein